VNYVKCDDVLFTAKKGESMKIIGKGKMICESIEGNVVL
jgi:hypothetical protein